MNRYIILSFLFMGVAYYELSGGNDFVPESRAGDLSAEAGVQTDMVTRQDTTTQTADNPLAIAGVPARLAEPIVQRAEPITVAAETELQGAETTEPSFASLVDPNGDAGGLGTTATAATASTDDIRLVDASSLNVRGGPSTSNDVVARLNRNDAVTVLADTGDGWVMIRTGNTEGWVSARYLTQ